MNIFENKKNFILILSSILLIVIALLFIPGLFRAKFKPAIETDTEITQIKSQAKDTSLESIKKDLDNTKLDDIDRELNLIDKELNASI